MGPLIGLVLLFIVISVLNDSFIDPSNLKNLARQISINALIAFGMTFVILTGGIDLSVGSILALSSALMASMITKGTNPELAIVLSAVIGILLGTVNGVIISYGKVAPFIATLATMTLPWCIQMATRFPAFPMTPFSPVSVRDLSLIFLYRLLSCLLHSLFFSSF